MNIKRYTIAGSLSLAVHAAFLFVAQEPKAFAMPAGAQSTSVSINFKAMATPPPPQPTPVESEPVVKSEPVPEPTKKVAKPEPKKVVKKPTPTKKPVVKKKTVGKKKITKSQPKKPTPPQPRKEHKVEKPVQEVVKKEKQPNPSLEETKAQPQQVNRGASSQPIMVQKPSFLTRPSAPKYPRLARKRGVEGIALYEVWLDEDGQQVKQVLISSSGATMLDKSALDAIKKWKFSPHTVGGQKMAHRVQIPVRFKLDR
ncbi:TonB family protein [Vibrio sp. TBV020]|uniref:energy transducer TonB n=1 Tax=Vibrio sp. TBV020 TaxID=3137398 RepID=UPI0038CD82DC